MRLSAPNLSWRAQSVLPHHFATFSQGRRTLLLRDDLASHADLIESRLQALDRNATDGAGNRRGGFRVAITDGLTLFVRFSRRGGLLACFNRDIYFGLRRRLMHEIAITAEARSRGIPVAEVLGIIVEPLVLGFERGAMITRAMAGMTLWEFLQIENDPLVRTLVSEEARRAVATMHRGGLCHADLNLHNLFVTRSGEQMTVVVLDLDKAQFFDAPLDTKLQSQNLNRLRRSAKKLDPQGLILTAEIVQMLTGE